MAEIGYYKELSYVIFRIFDLFLENNNLCKLMYYNEYNPLAESDFNTDLLINNHLNPLPKRPESESDKRAIVNVYFGETNPPTNNKGSRTERIYIDVICHLDSWLIQGGLRPYAIMNEIDSMLNGRILIKISEQDIIDRGANIIYASDYHAGYRMIYEFYNNSNLCRNR
jgi:hypothetical protein